MVGVYRCRWCINIYTIGCTIESDFSWFIRECLMNIFFYLNFCLNDPLTSNVHLFRAGIHFEEKLQWIWTSTLQHRNNLKLAPYLYTPRRVSGRECISSLTWYTAKDGWPWASFSFSVKSFRKIFQVLVLSERMANTEIKRLSISKHIFG